MSAAVLIALSAAPKTLTEVEDAFRGFGRRLPGDPRALGQLRTGTQLHAALAHALGEAVTAGLVVGEGERYRLTDAGRAEGRTAGTRGASQALIAQSVDSVHHDVAAVGVVAGLVAVTLHVPVVDTLIGGAIAVGILLSALRLAAELIRSARAGEEPDLSQYSARVIAQAQALVTDRVATWLLEVVYDERPMRRADLVSRAANAVDPNTNPLLDAFGMEPGAPLTGEKAVTTLVQRGWVTGGDQPSVADTGRRHLHIHRERHHQRSCVG
jgi:hypothetical protein